MRKLLYWMPLIVFLASCEVKIKEEIRPLNLISHFPDGQNIVFNAFISSDGNIVVSQDRRSTLSTTLYRYNADLEFLDSAVIPGNDYLDPVFDDEGNILLVGEDRNDYRMIITKLSRDLEVLGMADLSSKLPFGSIGYSYMPQITRLQSGLYVVGFTNEFPDPIRDRIILAAFNDPVNDDQPVWVDRPLTFTGEWMEEIKAARDGGFIISGHDHMELDETFLIKYTADGSRIWKTSLPYVPFKYDFSEDGDFIYYADREYFYKFNAGNGQQVIARSMPDEIKGINASEAVRLGDHLYFTLEIFNSDGMRLDVRKTDLDLNTLSSVIYGNQGTNIVSADTRPILKLSEREFIAVASVSNPTVSGNYWMLLKLDRDLKLTGE